MSWCFSCILEDDRWHSRLSYGGGGLSNGCSGLSCDCYWSQNDCALRQSLECVVWIFFIGIWFLDRHVLSCFAMNPLIWCLIKGAPQMISDPRCKISWGRLICGRRRSSFTASKWATVHGHMRSLREGGSTAFMCSWTLSALDAFFCIWCHVYTDVMMFIVFVVSWCSLCSWGFSTTRPRAWSNSQMDFPIHILGGLLTSTCPGSHADHPGNASVMCSVAWLGDMHILKAFLGTFFFDAFPLHEHWWTCALTKTKARRWRWYHHGASLWCLLMGLPHCNLSSCGK